MKLIFAAEDTLMGIVCGLLLIGYTGRFFSLKLSPVLYIIIFCIYAAFILMDIFNEIMDLTTHFGFIVFSLLHSFVDLVLALVVVSHFSSWNIPRVTDTLTPFFQNESVFFWAGAFLVFGNVIWLILYPFLD